MVERKWANLFCLFSLSQLPTSVEELNRTLIDANFHIKIQYVVWPSLSEKTTNIYIGIVLPMLAALFWRSRGSSRSLARRRARWSIMPCNAYTLTLRRLIARLTATHLALGYLLLEELIKEMVVGRNESPIDSISSSNSLCLENTCSSYENFLAQKTHCLSEQRNKLFVWLVRWHRKN